MLSEAKIAECLQSADCTGVVRMSFESGPYCIDRPTIKASRFAEQIESAATAPLLARIAEQDALIAKLRIEAQIHAQEARTANATIAEIYQSVTGGTGEPGNWHGAAPVKARIAELERHNNELVKRREFDVRDIKDSTAILVALTRELEEARKDAELLDWMIFYSARVGHDSDGEFCQCIWINEDGEQRTKLFGNAREAIRAAIKEQT